MNFHHRLSLGLPLLAILVITPDARSADQVIFPSRGPCVDEPCDDQLSAEYLLGKALFTGRVAPALDASSRLPSQFGSVIGRLPADARQAIGRVDGLLSNDQRSALFAYLRARYGDSIAIPSR